MANPNILFQNDWLRFPTAIADYATTNKSFLRMASLYRQMGVQNCLWPLALLNPAIQGLDPHGDDLTEEQKTAIGIECKYNIWYFLREVVRIPPTAGPRPIPYIANRGNLALTWTFINNIDIALIQPRQTGKSVSTDCVMVWMLYIGASNTKINMITKDHTLRTANVERLKGIRDYLPGYLIDKTSKDSDNQTGLTYNAKNNDYVAGVGQTSESAANNLGRGLASLLHTWMRDPSFALSAPLFLRPWHQGHRRVKKPRSLTVPMAIYLPQQRVRKTTVMAATCTA